MSYNKIESVLRKNLPKNTLRNLGKFPIIILGIYK